MGSYLGVIMNTIRDMVSTEQVTATSKWERLGDFLLKPKSWLYGRQRICVVGKTYEDVYDVRYKESSESKLYKAAGVIGLVLVPIGLLFKGVALLTSERTRTAYLNNDLIKHRITERGEKIQAYEKGRALFAKYVKEVGQKAKSDPNFRANLSEFFEKRNEVKQLENSIDIYKFAEIFQKATKDPKQTLIFLKSIGSDPTSYSSNLALMEGNQTQILGFQECACVDGQFNRLINDRRAKIEAQILSDITNRFPEKNKQIDIMSFGSGNLANEFVLLGLLVKAGYNNIRFVLIDSKYGHYDEETRTFRPYDQQLLEKMAYDDEKQGFLINFYRFKYILANKGIDVKLQVEPFKDIDDYFAIHPKEDLDVIIGVDIKLSDERVITTKEISPRVEEETKIREETREEERELESPFYRGIELETPFYRQFYAERRTIQEDLGTLKEKALRKNGKMHLALGQLNFKFSKNDNIDKAIEKERMEARLKHEKVGFIARLRIRSEFNKQFKSEKPLDSDSD